MADITKFFRQTTVSQFSAYSRGHADTPTRYCELTASLNADPDHCTLDKLNQLKKELCQRFLPPYSEFAILFRDCACVESGVELNWLIAVHLIPTVMTEFLRQENASFFKDVSIEKFQVRQITVYPDPNSGMPLIFL